jgi:hypothetical protein
MDGGSSQIVTALVGVGAVIVGSLISWGVQERLLKRRIEFDKSLAERRLAVDTELAERKFSFDIRLAERKFSQEKMQVLHRRRFEFADALLAEVYQFRDMMRYARAAVSFGGEGKTRAPQDAEADTIKSLRDTYFVPVERLQKQNEFLSKFFARQYTAAAHFGSDAMNAFNLLSQCLNRLQTASSVLITTAGMPNNDPNLIHEPKGDLWGGYAKTRRHEDKIETQIDQAVDIIEHFCQPILAWKGD